MARIILILLASLLCACGGGSAESDRAPVVPMPSPAPSPTPSPDEDDTEDNSDASVSKAQAAQWLLQASFGPDEESINQVSELGTEQWLEQQFDLPISKHLTLLTDTFGYDEIYGQHWVETWWMRSVYAEDQLRQRIAFALSQIMVISTKDDRLFNDPRAVASYYDTLLENSFGNFRDLLEDVTLHPAMGMYLSMLGNEKPDTDRNIRPDENYAREVMQLFSIGLVELNIDGTVKTDSSGNAIPTYDQDIIKGFAHVFTGWHFSGRLNWWEGDYNSTEPMAPYNEWHDQGEKQLLSGITLPAGQDAETDLTQALDVLFNHPNVGPFIGKQLIQRLVTSNPTPGYVSRVASVFNDNGSGVRGDMKSVIRAILLDEEARDESLRVTGKLRMPLLRLSHLFRAFDMRARDGGIGHEFVAYDLGIAPLDSPSVFNFYRPDYSQPGEIRDSGLESPEFQITNEISVTRFINHAFYSAYVNDLRGDEILEDDAGILHLQQLVELSEDHEALLDHLDTILLAGKMDDNMRAVLLDALEFWDQQETTWLKLANIVYLITISPQFAVQH